MGGGLTIGITGGIGSGKSIIREYLRSIGENVICADAVSREVVKPGKAGNSEIKRIFGDKFFNESGELDRKRLAEFVFSDKKKLEKLNSVLHPVIVQEIFRLAQQIKGRIFIEAPLLIQSGMQDKVDFVWLVISDTETRIKRVSGRDALSLEQVKQRIENQMSDSEMLKYADEVIENNGTAEELYGKIDYILAKPEYMR
jgi:dephospho-CoA kinase